MSTTSTTTHAPHATFASATPVEKKLSKATRDAIQGRQDISFPADLGQKLAPIVESAAGRNELLARVGELLLGLQDVVGVAALAMNADGARAVVFQKLQVEDQSWQRALIELSGQPNDATIKQNSSGNVTVVLLTRSARLQSLAVMLAPGVPMAVGLGVLQIVSAHFANWEQRKRSMQQGQELAATAAILELVARVESSAELKPACLAVVTLVAQHLRADRVVLGLAANSDQVCRITAISDVAEVDLYADETLRMKAALDECLVRGAAGCWPPAVENGVHQLVAHKKLAGRDGCVLTAPLTTIEGKTIGVIGVIGGRELLGSPLTRNFLAALDEPLGTALAAVKRAEGGRLQRLLRKVSDAKHRVTRRNCGLAALALVSIMLVPLPYKVRCGFVTEPVERRFSVAPHEGLLENTFAEPGDVVHQGALLARMDGRELRWELAGLAAEKSRAAKRRDTHLAGHETPDALLAELELKQLSSREQLLKFREENLEIRSQLAGIVLSGSLDRCENFPVSKGQVLYEIAPLYQVRVELGVPAEEINRVRTGMEVTMRFDGLGGDQRRGVVERIRPRAEIRDGRNVFVAEVVLDNPEQAIKPGMRGFGKVISERRPLAWNLFHRAWEHMAACMPW